MILFELKERDAKGSQQLLVRDRLDFSDFVPDSHISSGADVFVPVQLIEGTGGQPARVVLRAATKIMQHVTRRPVAEEQQLRVQQERMTGATATLRELREALPRSTAAIKAAVSAAADGSGDLNEVGALTIESHRIAAEIERQEALEKQGPAECARLQKLIDAEVKNPHYVRRLEAETSEVIFVLGPEQVNVFRGREYIVQRRIVHEPQCSTIRTPVEL